MSVNRFPSAKPSVNQPIPVVTLARFVAEVFYEPLHVANAHAEGRAGLRYDVLLDHDAAEVVRAELERDLADVRPLRDPRALHVFEIVEVDPAQRLRAEIFVRAHGWGPELRVLGLKRPADERSEVAAFLISAFCFLL